jgi:hypothetical protein
MRKPPEGGQLAVVGLAFGALVLGFKPVLAPVGHVINFFYLGTQFVEVVGNDEFKIGVGKAVVRQRAGSDKTALVDVANKAPRALRHVWVSEHSHIGLKAQ